MMCGYQILTTREMLSRTILREVRNEGVLQRVTIEEHQVGDLVSVPLQLFIQNAEGHIDLLVIQYTTNPRTTGNRRGVEIEGHRTTRNVSWS
jgi:hypothetical protein